MALSRDANRRLTLRPTYVHDPGVSNAIRYDALLVRELARELDVTLTGARVDALFFDRERLRLTIRTRSARRDAAPPPSLLWQLHPSAGHLTNAPDGAGAGRAQLPAGARIAAVTAPPDERLLFIDIAGDEAAAGAVRRIVVELMSNQWNAVATGTDGRIVALLRERQTAGRVLRAGVEWTPPARSGRAGANGMGMDEWLDLLAPVPPADRLRALPRLLAWTSPQNAAWILGRAGVDDGSAALEGAWRRHARLTAGTPLYPVLLQEDGSWQPYVSADPDGDTGLTLLQAFAVAAERADAAPEAPDAVEAALAVVAEQMENVDRRLRRLQDELEGAAAEANRLRHHADLLLSQLHAVERGATSVILDDFAGGTLDVELDPTIGAADNATQLYDRARRRDRAAARIPALQDAAREELLRLESVAARLRDGTAEPAEIERLRAARPDARDGPAPLPYRLYRTSGGLEVRVGKGSKSNDELTFRHSSPNDIWLHARDVAGAHVILRWSKTDENPPARDIADAAVLAALHSRARTSGTVPVDWTRRKYVRKPRKAGPGIVLPERVRTVFVEPGLGNAG
jgi:predicted ribosome quality control (RQC) complex YloA/Tae2 family protein